MSHADHATGFSHDTINRHLAQERMTPRMLWGQVEREIEVSPHGYVVFDDTVLNKNHSHSIELVRRQWRSAANLVRRQMRLTSHLRFCSSSREGTLIVDCNGPVFQGSGEHIKVIITATRIVDILIRIGVGAPFGVVEKIAIMTLASSIQIQGERPLFPVVKEGMGEFIPVVEIAHQVDGISPDGAWNGEVDAHFVWVGR